MPRKTSTPRRKVISLADERERRTSHYSRWAPPESAKAAERIILATPHNGRFVKQFVTWCDIVAAWVGVDGAPIKFRDDWMAANALWHPDIPDPVMKDVSAPGAKRRGKISDAAENKRGEIRQFTGRRPQSVPDDVVSEILTLRKSGISIRGIHERLKSRGVTKYRVEATIKQAA